AGFAEERPSAVAALIPTVNATAASAGAARPAEASAKAAHLPPRVRHLVDAAFDELPFRVVLHFEGFAITLHHARAHLFGVKISTPAPVTTLLAFLRVELTGPQQQRSRRPHRHQHVLYGSHKLD